MREVLITARSVDACFKRCGPARSLAAAEAPAGDCQTEQEVVLGLIGLEQLDDVVSTPLPQQQVCENALEIEVLRLDLHAVPEVKLGPANIPAPRGHFPELLPNPTPDRNGQATV